MSLQINTETRGERNNNPGNLNYMPEHAFQGQIGIELAGDPPRFGRYDTMANGIRALAELLVIYQKKYGCDTVGKIIDRYAPPSDSNPTDAYKAFVINWMSGELGAPEGYGLDPDQPVDVTIPANLHALVGGIIRFENGRCFYADGDLNGPILSALAAQRVEAGHE